MYVLQKQAHTKSFQTLDAKISVQTSPQTTPNTHPGKLKKISSVAMFELCLKPVQCCCLGPNPI